MKITAVKSYAVHPGWRKNLIFVKVETDAGIHGWGEAYSQYDRDTAVMAQLNALGPYMVGRSPFDIKHFTQFAFDDYAARRGSVELFCAVSGIEQSLWDIVGKAAKQPVYNLLGGKYREKIRVYANGWSYGMKEPDDYARAAEKVVKQGFTAMKFDPLPAPWRTWIPKEHEKRAVRVVKAIRDAVGPDIDLLIEQHRRLAPMHAIRLDQELAKFDLYWMEESCQAEYPDELALIRREIGVPMVIGEATYTKTGFRPLLEKRSADILNPDVACVGGILELKEIAAMAEPFLVAVSPHNYNSTLVALASTVHASATMPNFIITEYFLPFVDFCDRISPNQLKPKNGYIELPTAPGLGVDVDEAALLKHPAKVYPARKLRTPADEGP
ncbi:MAG: mandelate racemase/muconate lactonizing enzyme family protein [Betaproteobacteria bacterium]|jgi:galactonate dehydratase|nr:mandelate racemase/muconate lactonizing enzyme family protein [Betaproteobacteria bacterium]